MTTRNEVSAGNAVTTIDIESLSEELQTYFNTLFENDAGEHTAVPDTDIIRRLELTPFQHGDAVKLVLGQESLTLFYDGNNEDFLRAAAIDGVADTAVPLELNALVAFHPRYWVTAAPEITLIETRPLRELLGDREVTTNDIYLSKTYDQTDGHIGQSMVLPINLNGEVYYVLGDYGFDDLMNVEDVFLRDVLDGNVVRILGVNDDIPDLGLDPKKILFVSTK